MKAILIVMGVAMLATLFLSKRLFSKDDGNELGGEVVATEAQEVSTIDLVGFDAEGNPEIRIMSDGTLYLVFNFMPPSDLYEDPKAEIFEDFDKQIEAAIGVPVLWDDREFFLIENPKSDTIDKVKSFVESYREKM